jgi:hypothetical protein
MGDGARSVRWSSVKVEDDDEYEYEVSSSGLLDSSF